jgi:hypothetical protein
VRIVNFETETRDDDDDEMIIGENEDGYGLRVSIAS